MVTGHVSSGGVGVGTLSLYELLFKTQFVTSNGDAFQQLFNNIMRRRYREDFSAVRPWGKEGDRKNDGYLRSARKLFQCYAPYKMDAREAKQKIEEDFLGALGHWEQYFDSWVFVHNDMNGLGAPILEKLLEMDAHHPTVRCLEWGHIELFKQVEGLGIMDLISIFGHLPNRDTMWDIRLPDLDEILRRLESADPPVVTDLLQVPSDKEERNGLSPHVREMLGTGRLRMHLVDETISDWRDPARADAIAARFTAEYRALRTSIVDPDIIFGILWDMVRRGAPRNPKSESAAMAVLAYLFYSCDIFERE